MNTFATLENKKGHKVYFRIDRDADLNAWVLFKKVYDHTTFPKEYHLHWSAEKPSYLAVDKFFKNTEDAFDVVFTYFLDIVATLKEQGWIEVEA